jgi:DNA-directed RNA polymerase specialized sigma24 family protein
MSHLSTLTPLIGIIAREKTTTRPDLYDDARQEGLIRAWTVEESKPDAPREYVLAAARRGIGDVVRGRPAFGEVGRRGWKDAADTAHGFHLDADTAEDYAEALADPGAEAAFLAVEDRDARRRLYRAVKSLRPDLRFVVEERLAGSEFALIGHRADVSTATAHRRYKAAVAQIRTALKEPS